MYHVTWNNFYRTVNTKGYILVQLLSFQNKERTVYVHRQETKVGGRHGEKTIRLL